MDKEETLRIGDLATELGLSGDTLRYYEKIGLLKGIGRTPGGVRYYTQKNISALRFILRAKSMNFTLAEIKLLLLFREKPQNSRQAVRELTRHKLNLIEQKAIELESLRDELSSLLTLCDCNKKGCPIIEGIDKP